MARNKGAVSPNQGSRMQRFGGPKHQVPRTWPTTGDVHMHCSHRALHEGCCTNIAAHSRDVFCCTSRCHCGCCVQVHVSMHCTVTSAPAHMPNPKEVRPLDSREAPQQCFSGFMQLTKRMPRTKGALPRCRLGIRQSMALCWEKGRIVKPQREKRGKNRQHIVA